MSAKPFIQHAIDNLRTYREIRSKYNFGLHEGITSNTLRGSYYMELRIDIFTAVAETVKTIQDPYKRTPAYAVLLQALNDIFHNRLTDELIKIYSRVFDAYDIQYTAVTPTEEIETATLTETIELLKEKLPIEELAIVTETILRQMIGLELSEPVTVTELIDLLKAIYIDELPSVTETITKQMIGLEITEIPSVTETILKDMWIVWDYFKWDTYKWK